jgi:hypothetical protein
MSTAKVLSTRVMIRSGLLYLALLLFPLFAMAQSTNGNYILLLASGLACDPEDSSTCPAAAKSAQGDIYEMSGAGIFDVQNNSVKAAGTYTHKSAAGGVLETGVWLASELVRFDSYGIAPDALRQLGVTPGPQSFGARRLPMSFGPIPAGGLAVFHINFLPLSGTPRAAMLQVNCALGKVPDERPTEGIRLTFEGGGAAYDEEVSGHTLFILTRPEAIATPKKRQVSTVDEDLPPQEHNP